MSMRRISALGSIAALALFLFTIGMMSAPGSALATQKVVVGELFSADG